MKMIIQLFLLIFSFNSLFADCGTGISVYPEQSISQKGIILIEGYGWGKTLDIVKKLDKEFPIFLESKYHNVSLKAKEVFIGDFGIIQVVLQPEAKLIPNETYILRVQGELGTLNVENFFKVWNRESEKKVLREFMVLEKEDNEKPELIKSPILTTKQLTYFGCGPSINAVFQYQVNDVSDIIVRTELINLETNKKKVAYLKTVNGEIYVGQNMCNGFFKYEELTNYKVRFKFVDISGNVMDQWTDWIEFSSPNDKEYITSYKTR